jgi:hypothetical protein
VRKILPESRAGLIERKDAPGPRKKQPTQET